MWLLLQKKEIQQIYGINAWRHMSDKGLQNLVGNNLILGMKSYMIIVFVSIVYMVNNEEFHFLEVVMNKRNFF